MMSGLMAFSHDRVGIIGIRADTGQPVMQGPDVEREMLEIAPMDALFGQGFVKPDHERFVIGPNGSQQNASVFLEENGVTGFEPVGLRQKSGGTNGPITSGMKEIGVHGGAFWKKFNPLPAPVLCTG